MAWIHYHSRPQQVLGVRIQSLYVKKYTIARLPRRLSSIKQLQLEPLFLGNQSHCSVGFASPHVGSLLMVQHSDISPRLVFEYGAHIITAVAARCSTSNLQACHISPYNSVESLSALNLARILLLSTNTGKPPLQSPPAFLWGDKTAVRIRLLNRNTHNIYTQGKYQYIYNTYTMNTWKSYFMTGKQCKDSTRHINIFSPSVWRFVAHAHIIGSPSTEAFWDIELLDRHRIREEGLSCASSV